VGGFSCKQSRKKSSEAVFTDKGGNQLMLGGRVSVCCPIIQVQVQGGPDTRHTCVVFLRSS